jgi:hypothetical protein
MRICRLLPLILIGQLSAVAEASDGDRSRSVIDVVQRLSFDLRSKRLSASEQAEIGKLAGEGAKPREIYARYLDHWLGPWLDNYAFETILERRADKPLVPPNGGRLFLGNLSKHRDREDGAWRYFMPAIAKGGAPCAENEAVPVTPWWSPKTKILVCPSSYVPERAFDDVGFCGSKTELTNPQPPRPGCGCGALLLACMPPREDLPTFEADMNRGMRDELAVTVADLVRRGRPIDEALTTTKTWQSGIVQFMYLRRELIGKLEAQKWSPELERRLEADVAPVDLAAPARWVERKSVYQGSGVYFATPAIQTVVPSYREMITGVFGAFLCTDFQSVHVDSETVLKTVGKQHAHLRAVGIADSPMRKQVGCMGCHAPMDNATAFLVGLKTPLYGSSPTGLPAKGTFFLKGATDLRGEGAGFAGFAQLVAKQPEFEQCMVRHTFERIVQRSPLNVEQTGIEKLSHDFGIHHHDLAWLSREVFLSDSYTGGFQPSAEKPVALER